MTAEQSTALINICFEKRIITYDLKNISESTLGWLAGLMLVIRMVLLGLLLPKLLLESVSPSVPPHVVIEVCMPFTSCVLKGLMTVPCLRCRLTNEQRASITDFFRVSKVKKSHFLRLALTG